MLLMTRLQLTELSTNVEKYDIIDLKAWYDEKKSQIAGELAKKEAQLANDRKSNIKPSIQV